MKFPVESVKLSSRIKTYVSREEYEKVYKLKDEVLNNLEYFKKFDNEVLDDLIASTYLVGDIDRCILLSEELMKKEYESFIQIYYMILSYLSNEDIFGSLAMMRKSKILKDPETKSYYDSEEAHYSSLLSFDSDTYKALALVLCNFVIELSKESVFVKKIDKEYLFYRFFDVVNLLNEYGFSNNLVLKLSDDIRNVFIRQE